MITIKRAEIRQSHDMQTPPENEVILNKTIKNREFNSVIKKLHAMIKSKYPGKAINYIVYSEEEVEEVPEGFKMVERK
jgi:hypothetical protein